MNIEAFTATPWINSLQAIGATFVPMAFALLLVGYRLSVLAGDKVSVRDGVATNAIAQLIVLIIPSRISELAKPAGLNLISKLPLAQGLAVVAVERVFDAVILSIISIAAVVVVATPYQETIRFGSIFLVTFASLGVAGIAIFLTFPELLQRLASRLPFPWVARQILHVEASLVYVSNMSLVLKAIGLSAAAWFTSYLVFLLFFHVLEVAVLSPAEILVVFVASTLGLIISVTPGGLGTFEGAIAVALVSFGVPLGTAVALALLLRLCLVVPVIAIASWFLISGDLSLSRILTRLRDWRGRNDQGE